MSYEDWTAAVQPKVTGTWNLHNALLGVPLDFFWLASSTITVVDQAGQGNYKAGCMFLEAFCQYRHSLGLPASVLSICPIQDVGFVADNAYAKRSAIAQGIYMLWEREFLDCVEASLFGQRPPSPEQPTTVEQIQEWQSKGHIVMGLRSSSELHLDDDRNPTNWRRDPRMGFYHNKSLRPNTRNKTESSSLRTFMDRLAESGAAAAAMLSEEANVEFLATETGRKVMDFLLKPDASLDLSLSLAQLGMDSLTAIELRRWFRQAMGLQVTVLELMGSTSLRALGGMIAGKLREKHVEAF
jgi:aryl carrier-like protein